VRIYTSFFLVVAVSALLACGRTTTNPLPEGGAGGGGSGGEPAMGYGTVGQSCVGLEARCQGESCCTSIVVPGGTFIMGDDARLNGGSAPAHRVTLDAFALDKYEVTIGRYRRFLATYDGTPPPEGVGSHEHLPEGTGWQSRWNKALPASREALLASMDKVQSRTANYNWTREPGSHESHPISITSWTLAAMFCIWDGGRLPTDAEWEYAATGGDEERPFPWGSVPAAPDKALPCDVANFNYGNCAEGTLQHEIDQPLLAVGTLPRGAGRWGHQDLSGNAVDEVTFDAYLPGVFKGLVPEDWKRLPQKNPIYLTVATPEERGYRFSGIGTPLRRDGVNIQPVAVYGFRCARPVNKLPR